MIGLSGCSSSNDDTALVYEERPVEELYHEAQDKLENKQYKLAAEAFEEVEQQHPYSSWATKAQIMTAYARYEEGEFDEAIIALNRFISLHPGNKDIPYAYYLTALCYYEQISDVQRDQKMTDLAMKNLQEVVTRFPGSEYARDAKLKIDLTVDHLAGKQMAIGMYYYGQKQYLAALNRFKNVVKNFDTTTHIPEALFRTVEIYSILGLTQEAQKAAAVLGHNYPGNKWYQRAYNIVEKGETNTNYETEAPWWDVTEHLDVF
jgi:outer membrane protein assembly factor BamD